jgi:hypothetical protein
MSTTDLRSILAANLNRMIDLDTPAGAKRSVRAWAISKGVNVRLIDRLTKGQHAVTIDSLEAVAQELGLQAWQLLLPDLDPSAPADAPISEAEREMLRKLRRLLGD